MIKASYVCVFLAQLVELFIYAGRSAVCVSVSLCICVCPGVNHGGTNRNCYAQRLVILLALTYTDEPWSHTKR